MQPQASLPLEPATRPRLHITQELILAVLLVVEVAVFCVLGTNFATRGNAFEIVRLSVEIGLLALALTPVIVSGGIDLSVGSLMGLAAVLFGMMWRDGGLPIGIAALATLGVGAGAGGLNALLITRLRLPPLIVTLGTWSLFRGLAEGLPPDGPADNFTNFPAGFSFLGQGYLAGGIPTQLPIFLLVAVAFWVLLHRTTIGRALYAIGLSADGARYAGIPVARRLALVYVLCGTVASLAAIIYVAHLGQAKADAGVGYELLAITAVVLGGTSIFGGRGTIHGTVLGLFAIAVLENGLRLADLPSELAGILIGVLLLVTISMQRLAAKPAVAPRPAGEELEVKNTQVAVICAVVLLGALIVAASNYLLVRNLRQDSSTGPRITVAMMPKNKGNPYFIACQKGAVEAAAELGIDLIWDGPTNTAAAKQNEIIDTWITRGVDVIAVAVEDRVAIAEVLRKARQRGIKVITWDADAETDARDFLVNQATPQGIGQTLMDQGARVLGGKGEFAIITASLGSANMIEWQKNIEARRAEKYPDIKQVALLPCEDKQDKAFEQANTILTAHPDVKLIMAICSPGVPGAAEAVKQSQRKDVKVIGLGLPNENKVYVHGGITDCVVLWNTMDLGYLTVYAAAGLKRGTLRPGDRSIQAGRLRNIEIAGDNILLGQPFVFTKGNIDGFDF
jgi:ribose/xylose/arabinose/galactoside ABC-type transport system permease subunit/ABC-type sugar transport system substrate-binding protein